MVFEVWSLYRFIRMDIVFIKKKNIYVHCIKLLYLVNGKQGNLLSKIKTSAYLTL